MSLKNNNIYQGDAIELLKQVKEESVHCCVSDIPYGIGYEDWDVLHNNTNSAFGGNSDAQNQSALFKRRGKPINGWSLEDRNISKEYEQWCMKWAGELYKTLKPGASCFIFAGRRYAHRCISAFEESGFCLRDIIAWQKEQAPHRAQRISEVYKRRGDEENQKKFEGWRVGNLRPLFEPIIWFMKPYPQGGTIADNMLTNGVGAFNNEAWKKYASIDENIIKIHATEEDHGKHPTQKPIQLMEALIELSTFEGQTVIDPFMGSGSTCVAAKNLKRKYIGFELSEDYFKVAEERLK